MEAETFDPSSGIISFLLSIDWQEPWLWGLLCFHALCVVLTTFIIRLNLQGLQITLFTTYLGLIYFSEYINEWAAGNYRLFSTQQYFDSRGMFISLLFSTPLLLNCLCFIVNWMYTSVQTMIKLKRAKIRSEIKAMQEKSK